MPSEKLNYNKETKVLTLPDENDIRENPAVFGMYVLLLHALKLIRYGAFKTQQAGYAKLKIVVHFISSNCNLSASRTFPQGQTNDNPFRPLCKYPYMLFFYILFTFAFFLNV